VNYQRVSDATKEHLFGYYDKSPWDSLGCGIIFLQVPFANRHPTTRDEARIKLKDLKTGKIITLGITRAWNLQQGCRLQWLGPDFHRKVIFNDFRNDNFVSVVKELSSSSEEIINKPIYDVTSDGKYAITLNFERLHLFRPGYGYISNSTKKSFSSFSQNDGIWNINLKTKKVKLIISLMQIAEISGMVGQRISCASFNHIMINPSGTRFMFLYRWKICNMEFTSLFTANMDGSNIYCLAHNGLVSHATWKNDRELLAWTNQKDKGEHYFLFQDKKGIVSIVGEMELTGDGHPSYSPCGRYILADTYVNDARQRSLLIFDTIEEKVYNLGRFYTPFRYSGEFRCDLHPRWKRDGSQICLDAAFEGTRQVYVVNSPIG
jgi:hypothetical protein